MRPPRQFHGMSKTPIHERWRYMWSRVGRVGYEHVTVCDQWRDFLAFAKWADSTGFAPHLYLDRVFNLGGYSPENCRWVTPLESTKNRRMTPRRLAQIHGTSGWIPARAIRRLDTGVVYPSGIDCAKALGVTPRSVRRALKVSRPCRGVRLEYWVEPCAPG